MTGKVFQDQAEYSSAAEVVVGGNGIAKSYLEAREIFLSAVAKHGADVGSVEHPDALGPAGEGLHMDWALIGNAEARSAFVVTCGTHGIEGYAGSAVISRWLEQTKPGTFDAIKLILVHAVNPWGFAHGQRVNENNVDLNRNFIDFCHIPENPGYDELHRAIMLDQWSEEELEKAFAAMDCFRSLHGEKAFSDAFNGGQYAHADGIFYGGREPQWSNLTFRKMLREAVGSAENVHLLDLHTGIGPFGRPFHINFDAPGSAARTLAETIWGREALAGEGSTHAAFATYQGLLMDAASNELASRRVSRCVVEFGTYPRPRMQRAHLALAWSRRQKDRTSETALSAHSEYCDAFVPADAGWRQSVIRHGIELCTAASGRISKLDLAD